MITAAKAKTVGKNTVPFSKTVLPTLPKANSTPRGASQRKLNDSLPPAPEAGRSRTADGPQAVCAPIPGWKRSLDLICIVLSLPVVLPLMVLIVFWIRLVSRGPALFRQERIGQGGKKFVLYKFRSMKLNCGTSRHESYLRHLVRSDSPMIKLDLLCDSRLITGGCLLRAAGLDELPQLLNVLRGEMSLVGPRPCLTQEYAYFSAAQRERFKVVPGLTGSWQVSGKNQSTFSEMNAMDAHYSRHASLALDLRIMMRTPAALLLQMCQAFQQGRAANQVLGYRESAADAASCASTRIGWLE